MKNRVVIIRGIIAIGVILAINIYTRYSTYGNSISSVLLLGVGAFYLKLYLEKEKLKSKSENLEIEQRKYSIALEGLNGAIWEYNISNGESFIVDKGSDILDLTSNNVKTLQDWLVHIHPNDIENVKDIFLINTKEKAIKYLDGFFVEYRIVDFNGQIRWVFSKGKVEELNGEYICSGVNIDITELKDKELALDEIERRHKLAIEGSIDAIKEKELKIRYMSYYDSVTGLYNRHYLKKSINKYIELHKKEKNRAALIFIDLDNFKYINDSFGHEYGDVLLKYLSDKLKRTISEKDLLGRFGGDEFIIFLPNIEKISQVEEVLSGVTDIFKYPQNILGNYIYTSGSVGISMFPDDAADFATLLKNADAAMYRAKSNGKDTYQFFNDQIASEIIRLYEIEEGLREALDNNELYVEFQPKVVLTDNKIMGFEALARWKNKRLGFVSPAEFIPIAENNRMILKIGSFVLEEIFIKCKQLIELGHDNFKIAVNLSEVQLREGNIVEEFKYLILQYGISPKFIEIEITESMLMKSFDNNIKTLMALKDLDVSIALDDFGTGYSSLNYLTRLPIDILKIDRSFLLDIMENSKSKFVVENIIQLSHKLGIEVVAEGVEVKEQVDYLRSIFCDFVQGYYFSRPQSFENAAIMMKDRYIAV